jgi:hypothetical protein
MSAITEIKELVAQFKTVEAIDHHFSNVVWSLAREQWILLTSNEKAKLVDHCQHHPI